MKPKVFGVGWAKTGTTTLGRCLQILGYRHVSQRRDLIAAYADGNIEPILKAVREADSFEDWPWILLFRELNESFPGSLFVLTSRDSDRWLLSYRNMLRNQGAGTAELNQIRRKLYGLNFPDVTDAELLDRYSRHNNEVKNYFAQLSIPLLVVDWEKGHGWQELCGFLDMAIPSCAFPHENRAKYSDSDTLAMQDSSAERDCGMVPMRFTQQES